MRALILIMLLLLSGCTCIDGSGDVVLKEDYVVSYFDSVNLMGAADIYITQGDKNSLRVEAEDNLFDHLRFDVFNNELNIEQKTCIKPSKPIKVFVTMNDVKRLSVSGAGRLVSENELSSPDITVDISGAGETDLNVRTQKLTVDISGAGDTVFTGNADRFVYTLSGSGELDAGSLKTAITDVKISGAGDALVDAEQDLFVTVSGTGDVLYKGNPMVTSDISGSGKLEKV